MSWNIDAIAGSLPDAAKTGSASGAPRACEQKSDPRAGMGDVS
jgi:hypothetical protein